MENHGRKGTLLIVDDEVDLQEILEAVLSPIADRVILAPNGKVAFEHIRSGIVDAVLSDVNMPLMNGLQLLAETRSLGMPLPFVILTAFGDQENLREAIRLNATDFVSKPYSDEELTETMTYALKLGTAQRDLDAEMELAFAKSNVPVDQAIRIREIRKTILGMKIANARLRKSA